MSFWSPRSARIQNDEEGPMNSESFYLACALGYFAALFMYIANLVPKKAKLRKAATITVAGAFIAQTIGMLFRWHEAGVVEVAAKERALDITLTGKTWFIIYSQHPPWSNLYEIMVFMAWGIVLVYLVSEVKWRIRLAGIFALLMALVALALATMTGDATIKPLVPALQSWWIMIHVISSAVGYAAGSIGAVLSLLYLVKAKERVSLNAVAAGTLWTSAAIFIILGRGVELFTSAKYRVKLMGYDATGELIPVGRMSDGSFHPYYAPSPGVGYLLLAAVVACIGAGVFLWIRRRDSDGVPKGQNLWALMTAFGLSLSTTALIIINAFVQTDMQNKLSPETVKMLTHGAAPPWRLAIESAQWDLALFLILVGGQLFVVISCLVPSKVRDLLPEGKKLDRGAYYTILIAFALVAVVLVTGALWAHYAWGRYWGWDPKETGALVIWLVYALYLHARVTYGWVGVPSAVIAVLAFFVILAGFLGVNLGWFADGLHSYGSG
jgi:ABC-type transport system involved in cytochrome c biogenesis permease subunit